MSGKNLINSVSETVNDSLIGYTLIYPQLQLHTSTKAVFKPQWHIPNTKVSIISGGGSGHEPFAAGYVGDGMLFASVSGNVFCSPSASQILYAIQCASKSSEAGCLLIVPNYTGDCLNFGLAMEKAHLLGFKVAQVVVGDDCSIPNNELGKAGKRGLPGILLIIKIAGAMSNMGYTIEDIITNTTLLSNCIASCSIGLSACTVPGQGLMFELAQDEVEFGQGIHGEAGYKRMKLQSVSDIVSLMLKRIVPVIKISKRSSVAILINNFGGLSQLEQGILVKEVVIQLQQMDVIILRIYSGVLMTSLDSAGAHVSILKIPVRDVNLVLSYLDEPTDAPAWPTRPYSVPPADPQVITVKQKKLKERDIGPILFTSQEMLLNVCLFKASQAIIENEKFINDLDRGCGDGDCGSTLKNLAEGIIAAVNKLNVSHPGSLMTELANISEERMGGTSGAIYSLMFTAAATAFSDGDNKKNNWLQLWTKAGRIGINGIMKYSKAEPGDKTMLDVLHPVVCELEKNVDSVNYKDVAKNIAKVASKSAEDTKNMTPRAGRASYVKRQEYLKSVDAGAYAVSVWINAISLVLQN